MPGFTCERAIGNLWSICLGVNSLSLDWLVFERPEPVDLSKIFHYQNHQEALLLPQKIYTIF